MFSNAERKECQCRSVTQVLLIIVYISQHYLTSSCVKIMTSLFLLSGFDGPLQPGLNQEKELPQKLISPNLLSECAFLCGRQQ